MNSGRKWLSFFTPNPHPRDRIGLFFFGNPTVFGTLGVFINTDFVPGVSI